MNRDLIRDQDNYYGLLIWGRRLKQDDLEAAGLTERGLRELSDFVRSQDDDLVYAHQGTTVNWEHDDAVPREGTDAIVGRVLALATSELDEETGEGGAVCVRRSSLEGQAPVDPGFWAELKRRFGVAPHEEAEQVYLAVSGWTIATLWDGSYVYLADDNDFELPEDSDGEEDPESFHGTCSEDLPPGEVLQVAELPERFWLFAEYL